MKILLAEDNVMLHQLYQDILSGAGYEVIEVVDGVEAFNKMKEGGFDLVLIDYLMPGMSGIEVIEKLKKEPPISPNKKIIFMTNLDDPKKLDEIKDISDGYLLKSSFTPDQFLKKIQEFLQ